MNELTTEQMEERIWNVKEAFDNGDMFKNSKVIIIGGGHTNSRLELACQKLSTDAVIITPDKLTDICEKAGRPLDDILAMIEAMRAPVRNLAHEFEKAALAFNKAAQEFSSSIIINHHDDRPWYDKAAKQGGKKRKQNYNNRQPWRK